MSFAATSLCAGTGTFRFSLQHPLNRGWAVRALNWAERSLPAHRLGDIVLAVARKPYPGPQRPSRP